MQKLITIYLNSEGDFYHCFGQRSPGAESHGVVQEHLEEYLTKGWQITTAISVPTNSVRKDELGGACAWIAIILEK